MSDFVAIAETGTVSAAADALHVGPKDDLAPGPDLILEGDGDIWRITATPQSDSITARTCMGDGPSRCFVASLRYETPGLVTRSAW